MKHNDNFWPAWSRETSFEDRPFYEWDPQYHCCINPTLGYEKIVGPNEWVKIFVAELEGEWYYATLYCYDSGKILDICRLAPVNSKHRWPLRINSNALAFPTKADAVNEALHKYCTHSLLNHEWPVMPDVMKAVLAERGQLPWKGVQKPLL